MRNLKIYASFLLAVLLMACSDSDEKYNTGAAEVNLQETTMTVKESAGLCTVPVVITGEHEGNIRVTITVEDHNAKENENYVITTKHLIIPAGQDLAKFEFRTIDDDEMNADRTFDIRISDAQGATIGNRSKVAVTIKDNDSNLYEALAGTWIFTGTSSGNTTTDVKISFSVKVTTAEEGNDAYENYLTCTNTNGFDPDNDIPWSFSWRLKYNYNASTKKMALSIVLNEDVADYGLYTIRFRRLAIDGSRSDVYIGEYDTESATITFENANLIGDIYDKGQITALKFQAYGCKMVRIK